jgi:hypothetical protein
VRQQECAPRRRPLRHWRNPVRLERSGNRRTADAMAEVLQSALDSGVSPVRVLFRHPDDHASDLCDDTPVRCINWILVHAARSYSCNKPPRRSRRITVSVCEYRHRAHRSLNLTPPAGWSATQAHADSQKLTVVRRNRLGGLVHEYRRVA